MDSSATSQFTCAACDKSSSNLDASTGGLQRCSRCKTTYYCSQACQVAHWPSHKSHCRATTSSSSTSTSASPSPGGEITGVMVPCDGERRLHGFMKPVSIGPNHPIHIKGVISPVSQKLGFPVVIYRHLPDGGYDAEHDCQIATYLMIDPVSGFAPFEWQSAVGSITVMRQDGKPLTTQALETLWMFCSNLLDRFGDDDGGPGSQLKHMTPAAWKKFCRSYVEEVKGYGTRNDFDDVQSPF